MLATSFIIAATHITELSSYIFNNFKKLLLIFFSSLKISLLKESY